MERWGSRGSERTKRGMKRRDSLDEKLHVGSVCMCVYMFLYCSIRFKMNGWLARQWPPCQHPPAQTMVSCSLYLMLVLSLLFRETWYWWVSLSIPPPPTLLYNSLSPIFHRVKVQKTYPDTRAAGSSTWISLTSMQCERAMRVSVTLFSHTHIRNGCHHWREHSGSNTLAWYSR